MQQHPVTCLCCCDKRYADLNRKSFGSYEDWRKDFKKKWKRFRKEYTEESLALIKKCNSVHKGSKYIKNTPGFIVELKGVNKWFGNKVEGRFSQILYNVNLKIREGEFVVVLGFSGSGKSTLLNILGGIERPSNGTVIVANHNLISLSEKDLTQFRKENISFIFQNYALLSELTVRENIMQGAELQDNVKRRLSLDEFVKYLSIEEHLDKYPNQLSGGQQQRVAIVKSVIKNPKILFADEPTAAVDDETCRSILEIFCYINKKYKTTIVLITHNPVIAKIGTTLIRISKGRVVDAFRQVPTPLDKLPWAPSESHE